MEKGAEKSLEIIDSSNHPEVDYSYLDKYFIEDSQVKKSGPKVNEIVEDISIAESPFKMYDGGEVKTEEIPGKEKKVPEEDKKKITGIKKQYFKDLEKGDSLNLDTCAKVGTDRK
jgi:hypothetical protein